MVHLLLATLALASTLVSAAPQGWGDWSGKGPAPSWQGQGQWGDWNGQGWQPWKCDDSNKQIRKDFDRLPPAERKEYTDAIKCIISQPSQLDSEKYPAAINRFFDWAVTHVNHTAVAHLDGFFLVWHRMFLHLWEQDLKNICGYKGALPYWNWPATAGHMEDSVIFSGDDYSMSGNGEYIDYGPYQLSPTFSIPKGSGGGCIKSGPFQGLNYTMKPISNQPLLSGTGVPADAYQRINTCLTRDLNDLVSATQTNWTEYDAAIAAPDQATFQTLLNGVFGGGSLGLHSGAHFSVGPPASSIWVSPQDPIWYPLHTFLDLMYVQWQKAHPEVADQLFGTMTAVNLPPSANVTLDSITPDFGYFFPGVKVSDIISTTAGPFCYDYEFDRTSY